MKVLRAGFVNSGILGHGSVARLVHESLASHADIDETRIVTSEALTIPERTMRRLLGFDRVRGAYGAREALLLTRWRHELIAGLIAARRLASEERRRGRFDVLHFHTQATAMASVRRMRRTPSIVSIDITQQLARMESSSALASLAFLPSARHDGVVFRAAAAIVSPSRWAAESVATVYPGCAAKVHVIPYPVRVDSHALAWIEERAARHLGAPAAEIPEAARPVVRVLFLGGDFLRKGGMDLVAAWRDGGFHPRAELRLVTDWPLSPASLPPGVVLLRNIKAFSTEWTAAWREADVFVMPTRAEAFGMVFQEAAAAGVPAIGTQVNAVAEIIDHGTTGLLVAPGNRGALIAAIESLIGNAELRMRLGRAAHERATREWSISGYGAVLTKLLRDAVRGAA